MAFLKSATGHVPRINVVSFSPDAEGKGPGIRIACNEIEVTAPQRRVRTYC